MKIFYGFPSSDRVGFPIQTMRFVSIMVCLDVGPTKITQGGRKAALCTEDVLSKTTSLV